MKQSDQETGTPLRVLIIEDLQEDAELLLVALRRGGYQPEWERVQTRAEMHAALQRPWDVVLADYRLPHFSGLDALQELKASDQDLPFIIVSGTIGEETAVAAMKMGAHDYLMKDRLTRLVPAIQRELRDAASRQEHRRAQEALRASAERFRLLIEKASDCFMVVDAAAAIQYVSPTIERVLGYAADGILGTSLLAYVHPGDATRLRKTLDGVIAVALRSAHTVVRVRHGDGSWRFVEGVVTNLTDSAPVGGLVFNFRDTTERKRAEEELHDREADLVNAQKLARVGNWRYDPQTQTAQWSEEMFRIFGLALQEDAVAAAAWRQCIHPEDVHRFDAAMATALREETGFDVELRVVRPDGTVADVRALCEAQFGQEGTAVQLVGVAQDITRRRRAQAQIRRLALVVEQAAEGVVITDTAGVVQYVNPAFEKMTGYERSEVLNHPLRLLQKDQHDDDLYRAMWAALAAGQPWRGQVKDRAKNGSSLDIEVVISPIRDANDRVINYAADLRDVTRELQLEQQFRQSQKMEAVGRLAGGIAHDFNNLLQAITGYTDLLLAEVVPPDPRRSDLLAIQEAARRAQGLTRQLLAFGRKQMIEPRVQELNLLVESSRRLLRPLIGEDIQLVTDLEPHPWRVRVDAGQMDHVLMNLVVNARDAMPKGGRITLATRNVVLGDGEAAAIPESRPGPFVCLSVTDTGVGMSPEVQRHLFEPFFTTKGMGKGTGLGLAMAYGTAKQHEGWIHVVSKAGKGSTFTVYLPALPLSEEVAESRSDPDHGAPADGHGERLLLVEDEPGVRTLATRILREHGYVVQPVATAAEAVEAFAAAGGKFDLIFTDVVLPDRNGVDLAAELTAGDPGIRVLLTSGYSDERSRWPEIQARGLKLIQKPYTIPALLGTVHRALAEPAVPG